MALSKIDVRNPVLRLPVFQRVHTLPPEARELLVEILSDLAAEARQTAEHSWRRHKAPMAAYWKAVSVYAGHIRKAIQFTNSKEKGRRNGW